jgi:hypothetical protein
MLGSETPIQKSQCNTMAYVASLLYFAASGPENLVVSVGLSDRTLFTLGKYLPSLLGDSIKQGFPE